jgi:hypothetical protein
MVINIAKNVANPVVQQFDEQLENLLLIHEEEVKKLFEEVKCETFFTNIPENSTDSFLNKNNFRYYFIKFDHNGNIDFDKFVRNLKPIIGKYCIPRWKQKKLSDDDLYQRARQIFVNNGNTGEPGELLIYALIEGELKAPKIVSKMSLKTNPNTPVYGSDGIHLGVKNQNLLLIFGESKLISDRKQAISNALSSIQDFIYKKDPGRLTMQQFELDIVLSNQIDVDEPLRGQLMGILDPYNRDGQMPSKYVCFIGYDQASGLRKNFSNDREFLNGISKDMIQKTIDVINDLFNEEQFRPIKGLDFEFFIVPFNTLENFRTYFIDQIVMGIE